MDNMTTPITPILTPLKWGLPADSAGAMDVLVRLRPTDTPAGEQPTRPPLNLAIVIDASSSMSGRPIEQAKRCAANIVDGLRDSDRIAIISYANDVRTVVTSTPVESAKDRIRSAIASIQPGGMTNLHGGWLAGCEQVASHLDPATISRVLLLSDGQVNQGIRDPSEISRQVRELASQTITTSTYGLGASFNEDLMAQMADEGQGNAYYGETAEDLAPHFEMELGMLSMTAARTVRLHAKASGSVEILNQLQKTDEATWALPNIVHGADAWCVLRIPYTAMAEGTTTPLVGITVSWSRPDGTPGETITAEISVPVLSQTDWDSMDEDVFVRERVRELEAARLQMEARQAALKGDLDGTKTVLRQMQDIAGENAWVSGVAQELLSLAEAGDTMTLSKEAMYSSKSMRTRHAGATEDHTTLAIGGTASAYNAKRLRSGRTRKV